jgi:hypothetical protein
MARSAGDVTWKWGSPTELTFPGGAGPDGLADAGTKTSDELVISGLDNAVDVLFGTKHKTASGTLASHASVNLYAVCPPDGTNYTSAAKQAIPLGAVPVATANTTEYSAQYSLAAAFGGVLPEKCKVVLENGTGLALGGTANQNAENKVYYQVVYGNQQT